MPFATYMATESIAPGHVANTEYTIRFGVQSADLLPEILKREQRSMSGRKETLHFGRVRRWKIVLEPVPAELLPYFDEFLDSTADGQAFQIDPYGSEVNHGLLLNVDREDAGHAVRRVTTTGDPAYSDMFEISFEVSELA